MCVCVCVCVCVTICVNVMVCRWCKYDHICNNSITEFDLWIHGTCTHTVNVCGCGMVSVHVLGCLSLLLLINFVLLASYGKSLLFEQPTVLVPFSKVARFGIWMNTDFTNLTLTAKVLCPVGCYNHSHIFSELRVLNRMESTNTCQF